MKNICNKFNDFKLANKFLLVSISFIGIYSIIVLIAFRISLNIYDEKLYEKSIQELDFFIQNVNEELEELEKLSYFIAMKKESQNQLSIITALDNLDEKYEYELNKFKQTILNELNVNKLIKNIIYIYDDEIKFNIGVQTPEIKEETLDNLLLEFSQARGAYVAKNPTNEYPYLVSGRDILKYTDVSLDYLGTLVFISDISDIIENQISSLESESASLYVYSEDGVIFESDENIGVDVSKVSSQNQYNIITIDNEKYFMCYLTSSQNGWTYVNVFPYTEIYGKVENVKHFIMIGLSGLFLVLFFVMKKVSSMVTKPLEKLTESMKIVETGDFKNAKKVLEKNDHKDEVGLLTQEFSVTLDNIHLLIHENYEKQLLLKDIEYKMLQAQMNPHFLYNTLNTINWLIRASRNDEAIKMIIQLGDMLRASFAKKHYVSVESDLNLAKTYIGIQEYRYKNRIKFIINSEGDLSKYLIPHMTIQPLIENSIQHGVEPSLKLCNIIISIYEEESSILIKVSDSGVGMSNEELENVKNFTAKSKGNGIGLKNISQRLKIIHTNSEFDIESHIGIGTTISIRIPKIRSEENV